MLADSAFRNIPGKLASADHSVERNVGTHGGEGSITRRQGPLRASDFFRFESKNDKFLEKSRAVRAMKATEDHQN